MTQPRAVDESRSRLISTSRRMFGARGFHSTSMADLALRARVSVGQIYRFFPSKDDIIVAIAEDNARRDIEALEAITRAVSLTALSFGEALERFAHVALMRVADGLTLEILAESKRNSRVAEIVRCATDRHRILFHELGRHATPHPSLAALDDVAEIMGAFFYGLALQSPSGSAADARRLSRTIACLVERAIGVSVACATR